MSDRIFITGGAGFIGTRLVRTLVEQDASRRIWVLDSLHPQVHGDEPETPEFPPNVVFVRGDVESAETLRDIVAEARPQLIYHLAAETGTGQSYDEPARYCRVNIGGTANLIEAVRATSGVRKIVLAASRAVYGEGGYIDADGREVVALPRDPGRMSTGDFSVSLPGPARAPFVPAPSHPGLSPAPSSIYASTKLMQEYLLRQGGEGASWSAAILRFQNVYGPGQSLRNPYTGVLSIFSNQLLAGDELAIFEDGEIARDFVYVDDVVDALVRAGAGTMAHGNIIDIGSGQAVTILAVARVLMKALGLQDDKFQISGQFRVGDIRHACADIRAAKEVLGWEPKVSIEDGLTRFSLWSKAEYESFNAARRS